MYVLDRCSRKLIPYIGEIGEPGTCWLFDSDNDKGENGHPGEADTVANTFIFISVLTTCAAEMFIKFPALAPHKNLKSLIIFRLLREQFGKWLLQERMVGPHLAPGYVIIYLFSSQTSLL